jgi:hypothetical protein
MFRRRQEARELEARAEIVDGRVTVDGRAAITTVELERGGAAVCRGCGASLRLELTGRTDARAMRHERGCALGKAIARIGKPVLFVPRAKPQSGG